MLKTILAQLVAYHKYKEIYMDALMQWEISMIQALQSLSGLTDLMRFFSFFGNEEFFLFVMPVFIWCVDVGLGTRLAVVLIASIGFNDVLKIAFHQPRPYWVDLRVKALSSETSYGIPSGHAMNATAMWGLLATYLRRWWAWLAIVGLIFMISLSRLYLGVHFPGDVLAGWLFGALLLGAFLAFEKPVTAWFKSLRLWEQIGLAFAISLIYLAIYGGVLSLVNAKPDPLIWQENAVLATAAPAGESAIDPRDPQGGFTAAGSMMGMGLAFALANYRPTQFDCQGPLAKRGLRFLLGLAGVLVLWLGLKMITPAEPLALALIARYLRYALILFWVLYLAPLLFVKLRC
jgi:membrane-associated phospholipid phosphatase